MFDIPDMGIPFANSGTVVAKIWYVSGLSHLVFDLLVREAPSQTYNARWLQIQKYQYAIERVETKFSEDDRLVMTEDADCGVRWRKFLHQS